MMATEDVHAYDLDDEFDQLIGDIDFEDIGDAVQCTEKAPTTEDGLVVAAVEGSDREAIGGTGSCHEPVPVIQQLVRTFRTPCGSNFSNSNLFELFKLQPVQTF